MAGLRDREPGFRGKKTPSPAIQGPVHALRPLTPAEAADSELIAATLEGSHGAFEQLVGRYQDRVYRMLARFTKDPGDAEDLTQDVFVKVFQKLHTFQQDATFFTWLYRIAVNAANDALARKKRRALTLVGDTGDLDRGEREAGHAGAAEPVLHEEMRRVVREVLGTLPDKYRTILVLREFDDLSYTDMAEVLECSLGTVESRLFRARQRFKEALERLHPDLVPQLRGART